MRIITVFVSFLLLGANSTVVHAQDLATEVAELRGLLNEMQQDYEARISELEIRLARAEQAAASAKSDAAEAFEIAEETSITQSHGASGPNAFNPAIGAILSGLY
jgi:Sec-independent protein translocase protein TatA